MTGLAIHLLIGLSILLLSLLKMVPMLVQIVALTRRFFAAAGHAAARLPVATPSGPLVVEVR